jgi:hypothetical protein
VFGDGRNLDESIRGLTEANGSGLPSSKIKRTYRVLAMVLTSLL